MDKLLKEVMILDEAKIKEYPETHQEGYILIKDNIPVGSHIEGDFGVQIASDGRVWICIDGLAFIRFSPYSDYERKKRLEEAVKEGLK